MSKAVLRAKIRVGSVIETVSHDGTNKGEKLNERIIAHAVYSDDPTSENKQWSKWTPSFHLDMTINNPGAWGKVKIGEEFLVDFILAAETKES